MATKEVETKEAEVKEAQPEAAAPEEETQASRASRIIMNYSLGTAGAGLIPLPLADVTVITAVQLKMLHSLSKLYEVPFTRHLGKSLIASLTGGVAAEGIGRGMLSSLVKAVPLVGPVVGWATMPVVACGFTYAIGKVFMQHFESGGTLLDFDPDEMKAYFAEQFEQGKLTVSRANQ